MATLNILGKGVPVDAGETLSGTTPFSASHDIGTDAPCTVMQVELIVPSGETAALSKVTVAGNVAPLLGAATSGMYFLGEEQGFMPGEKLRAVTSNVQSGAREFRVKARR